MFPKRNSIQNSIPYRQGSIWRRIPVDFVQQSLKQFVFLAQSQYSSGNLLTVGELLTVDNIQ